RSRQSRISASVSSTRKAGTKRCRGSLMRARSAPCHQLEVAAVPRHRAGRREAAAAVETDSVVVRGDDLTIEIHDPDLFGMTNQEREGPAPQALAPRFRGNDEASPRRFPFRQADTVEGDRPDRS